MIFFYIFITSYFFIKLFKQDLKKFNLLLPFLTINIVIIFLYLFVDEITGGGFTRSFWYHLNFDIKSGTYYPYLLSFLINFLLLIFATSIALFLTFKFFNYKKINIYKSSILLLLVNPAFYSLALSYFDWKNLSSNQDRNLKISNYFYDVKKSNIKFDKRDLIFISVESFERTFYEIKLSQEIKFNLLNREDIYDFNNIKQIENYTDWTIAGLVAANCGRPITYINNSRTLDYFKSFSANSLCLSDLLDQKKYRQFLIQGSSLDFGGYGDFYKLHKVDEQFGKNEIKKEYINQNLETSHWGLHDNHVLDFALKQINKLEQIGKPYAIWLNTLDNHAPSGLLSNYCKEISGDVENKMLGIAKCTDLFLNNFVNDSLKNDFNKNNIIIIYSDHLLMNSNFQKNFFDNKEKRRNLFLIIDPYKIKKRKEYNSSGNHFDIAATVLDYISDLNRVGLGKSLLNTDFSTKDLDFSISPDFNDFQIIRSYEKKLRNEKNIFSSTFKIDFNSGNIIFENNTKLRSPIISSNQFIYTPSEDVDGKSKENLTEMIFNNRKKILSENEFNIIAKCVQMNSFFDLDEKCKFGKLNIKKQNKKYLINFKKLSRESLYSFNSTEYDTSFLIERKFLIEKIDNYANMQPNKSIHILKKRLKTLLEAINPKVFAFFQNWYRELRYDLVKLKLNGLGQIFNSKNFKINKENFIAHSGGSIEGNIYSNSLEALDLSYSKGIRIFELDLKLTEDNELVAVHDWTSWKKMTKYPKNTPPSKEDFMNFKILGRYSPLDLQMINDWQTKNNDAIIITDKFDNLKFLNDSFKNNQKFIHEIYDYKQLLIAFKSSFKNILVSEKILRENNFTIDFLRKLKSNNIYGLSVSRYSIYKFPEFYKAARDLGLKVFVYRINDNLPGGSEKEVICNFNNFIDAIYADNLPDFNSKKVEFYCD